MAKLTVPATTVRFAIYVEHPQKGLVPSAFFKGRYHTVEEAKATVATWTEQWTKGGIDFLPMHVVKSTLSYEIV